MGSAILDDSQNRLTSLLSEQCAFCKQVALARTQPFCHSYHDSPSESRVVAKETTTSGTSTRGKGRKEGEMGARAPKTHIQSVARPDRGSPPRKLTSSGFLQERDSTHWLRALSLPPAEKMWSQVEQGLHQTGVTIRQLFSLYRSNSSHHFYPQTKITCACKCCVVD